jgi:hypothetical protein
MCTHTNMTRLAILACGALFVLSNITGCGGDSLATSFPPDDVARQALDAALKTWRDGGKPGPVAGTAPPVQVHDTPWALGDRLSSYEIIGEAKNPAERRFSVRLSLAKPDRVQEVEYYVLGRDPVMVFRDEDYVRNINMDNGPKLTKPAGSARRRQR